MTSEHIPVPIATLHMFFMVSVMLKEKGSMIPHPPSSMGLPMRDHLTKDTSREVMFQPK